MTTVEQKAVHTPGPWRWEFNRKHKSMKLVGGKPMFDLTIMDFARWGIRGAVAVMRDTAHDGFNIMHRVSDRGDWITPFPGRAHHADWCSGLSHPDLKLIEAAPDLLTALKAAEMAMLGYTVRNDVLSAALTSARAAIEKATGSAA